MNDCTEKASCDDVNPVVRADPQDGTMSIRVHLALSLALALAVGAFLAGRAAPARADGPGPDGPMEVDRDTPAPTYGRPFREVSPRPQRRVTGGPGYVGSEWGLGKPSYYGIGTRPDWGRSSGD